MDESSIARIRSFHRTVMTSIGALDARFLGRQRPLAEARLLWEIGPDGADVRDLRRRLALDSGYLSRLLRSLERQGLIVIVRGTPDARVRHARLTSAGRAERDALDRASDALARSLIDPLETSERERLVAAMADVERLLLRSRTTVSIEPPTSPDVRHCFARYYAELDARFEGGFDVGRSGPLDAEDLTPPRGFVLVARIGEEPVACGAVRWYPDRVAEIKRMWVAPHVRGLGLATRLLRELEDRACEEGATLARLETNRSLVEAIRLYRRAGYREVPPFNDEPYAHHWFAKRLDGDGQPTTDGRRGR